MRIRIHSTAGVGIKLVKQGGARGRLFDHFPITQSGGIERVPKLMV